LRSAAFIKEKMMSLITNIKRADQDPLLKAYKEGGERIEQVEDVKTDISFVSIFSNLIKKMDETAQAAQ
jgi:hypothetical protein